MRGGEPDMAKVAALREELAENLDVYEYILSKQSYIGGEVKALFLYGIFAKYSNLFQYTRHSLLLIFSICHMAQCL
jgi:hypothetical protein